LTGAATRRLRLPWARVALGAHKHGNQVLALAPEGTRAPDGAWQEVRAMKRVIVVDDQAYIREILCELLANEPGLVVAGAGADGREGIALADRVRPDVVVMDLKMPQMNGADAAAAILARHPSMRVIVLTVAPHGQLAAQARLAGVRACVPKSAPYTALLKAVRAA
jgi:DNA-binding NarL/FixJ family response regulator